MIAPGRLLVVGTPIGNMGDLSSRAVEALGAADAIACEDTRRTGLLLRRVGIGKKKLLLSNEHTEAGRAASIIDRLLAGETVALVSDAGMPGVSDPGQRLVRAVLDADLAVEVVPGPTALVTALVASGLPAERFVFEGFLPRKGADRKARLSEIGVEHRTVVFYESPRRIVATLGDLAAVCGERQVAVARELTKLHEEVRRGSAADLQRHFGDAGGRGEFVVVVAGAAPRSEESSDAELIALLRSELDVGSSTRDAVAAVVASTGEPKRRVYSLATHLSAREHRG